MKNIYILILGVILTGCMTTKFKTETGLVKWSKSTQDEVQKMCVDNNIHNPLIFKIRACYRMEGEVCHIYSIDNKENMDALGHELKHCFDGQFHDKNGYWLE